jgi:hypothetical protein
MTENEEMNAAHATPAAPPGLGLVPGRSGHAGLTLALLGAGFAWFAYIDAPITDGAMLLFTAAVASGFLSVCAVIIGGGAARAGHAVSGARVLRAAALLFLLSLALLLAAATVTLNLKGTGGDEAQTQTTVTRPA